MASSRMSWKERMRRRAKEVKEGMALYMNDALVVTGKELVLATPVKTGVMRSNWIAGTMPSSTVRPAFQNLGDYQPFPHQQVEMAEQTGPNYSGAVAQHRAFAKTHLNPLQPMFISNAVPYVSEVNYGTAQQTPTGFVERALDRAPGRMSRTTKLFGRSRPFVRF